MARIKYVVLCAVVVVVSLSIVGCATFPEDRTPTQKSRLTTGSVKKEIIKGKTTQAEVMELFGAPNLVTKNRSNNEVWNYNKMSYTSKTGADGMSLILWGGSRAMSSTTTSSFDLIIEFDENDVVKDYSIISASY
jgi:outer membrane protein assembly factor BamE (lipoprotein component of BamABCDE complex)